MSLIRLATAANVLAFQNFTDALSTSDGKWSHLIDHDGLQDEIGRFRVWSGNLGALQKGHSSLDYRLRDSPLLSTNTLKFLKELESNINEAFAIVSETRLPYELQSKPEVTEDDDDDDFFDDDDDDDDYYNGSRTELSMRFSEIVDIIDNLYKLSVRIRTPTIRTRSLKAATYKPKDPETGVDILSTYADYDHQHVKELLRYLRQPHEGETESIDYEYLTARLSAAITLRRRQFKYWKRHRDKLGMSTVQEEDTREERPVINRPEIPQRMDTLEVLPGTPLIVRNKDAPSQKTGKTLLSGTEATQHHQSLDEIVDTKSVTSYAVTVKDLHGKGVELPPPPRAADSEKDFECPYCYIICPARYGRGRAWRTHLLQDLQPYVCTYPECDNSEQLFRSRREWAEHEASHRKVWRCPEHPTAVYKTSAGLEAHFRSEHSDSFPESQLSAIVKVGETTTVDTRETCPICAAPAEIEGVGDFHNHIANHLERFATFALPNGREDDSDGASSAASRGRSESSESRNMSDLSLPLDARDASEILGPSEERGALGMSSLDDDNIQESGPKAALSPETLERLPDGTQDRLGAMFSTTDGKLEDNKSIQSSDTESSGYYAPESYAKDEGDASKLVTLNVSDIPTIRSLYMTRRLQQRDQSFAPNDKYNKIISFCHHDLTKLKVDAIVNSANKSLKMTGGKTLNNAIHRAAGPSLASETRLAGKLEGRGIITSGYNLPSKHVIHVLRPGYSRSRGMGQFNQLIDCYREAFKVAIDNNLKTIAFPCLGTGGVGFPSRVAARITLQEIREYLDSHPEHTLERIIFCVNTAADEQAYIDFLPVYFPPTHDNLESARGTWSEDYAALAIQILETRNEVQKVFSELNIGMSLSVADFPQDVLTHFAAIDSALASIRRYLLWSNDLSKNMRDLKLVCTVLQLFCGNITEIIDLAKDHANLGQRSDKSIWDDYVTDMGSRLQTNPSEFLQLCRGLIESLDSMITGKGSDLDEVMEMVQIRQKLESYKVKQRGGREGEGTQDHLNEVLYTREFQRESIAQPRDTVKLHRILSVTQLYQNGELWEKPTLAVPSEAFNDKTYFVREDITKLEVDIMVNSTDVSFTGMGTLDRTVFQKGGEQLRSAVMSFRDCRIGDVRYTRGYLLPAKHVLHVVPPEIYNKDTKGILKKIYQSILHEAVSLKATSIALPCIGTGMLNYPRRDSASLALEEVKRFLESMEGYCPLEKIIFVVFSSNDEFVYKSLMPVYFPPLDAGRKASPRQNTGISTSSESSDAPRRTLFGSIGEAFRSVRIGKQSDTPRSITANEEHALIEFESHAKDCEICRDIERLYLEGRDLCQDGYFLAQTVLWHMNMQADRGIYTKPDIKGTSVKLELPTDMFPISLQMLSTVEQSYHDKSRSRPFVTPNRSYSAITQDQGVYMSQSDENGVPGPKRARARVLITCDPASEPEAVSPRECEILVYPDRVDVFPRPNAEISRRLLLSVSLSNSSSVRRFKTTPEVELDGVTRLQPSITKTKGKVSFRCRSDDECNSLLRAIRQAITSVQEPPTDNTSHVVADESNVNPWEESWIVQGVTTTVTMANSEDDDILNIGYAIGLSPGKIVAMSRVDNMGISVPLLKLQLHGTSTIQRHRNVPEATVSGATHLPDTRVQTPYNTAGDVKFRCGNDGDCDKLVRKIQGDIERLQASEGTQGEQDTARPPAEQDQNSFEEYVKWNRRLVDVRNELAGAKNASGGLTNLQYKMERLSAATVKIGEVPEQSSDVSRLSDPSRSALAARILLCLTADLKSRPGSYIGLNTDSIVSAVRADKQEVVLALEELFAEDQIHNTVNEDTWVITHTPDDLPVLAEQQPESSTKDNDAAEEPYYPDDPIFVTSNLDSGPPVSSPGPSTSAISPVDPTSPQEPTHLQPSDSDNPTTTAERSISTAPPQLSPTTQKVYTYLLNYTFAPPDGAHHILDIAAAVYLTREEVRIALAELKDLGLANVTGKNGWWWATKAEPVQGQVQAQAQEVREGREGKTEESGGPRQSLPSLMPAASTSRNEESGDSKRGEGGSTGRADDKGKGKGKEREKRDVEQEKLDRVIAGDIKEDELRRYDEDENERYADMMQRRFMQRR